MSSSIEAIQAELVNAGSYRTHHIKRQNLRRLILWSTPPDPSKPRHWTYGGFKGWLIGDDHEYDDQEVGDYGFFISVAIYITDRGSYVAAVEEGWRTRNPVAMERDSVFHASPWTCNTPQEVYEWLSSSWKHSTAMEGAWEKACRTYPPMRQGGL